MTLASTPSLPGRSSAHAPANRAIDQFCQRRDHALESSDGHSSADQRREQLARRIVTAVELQLHTPPPAVVFRSRRDSSYAPFGDTSFERVVVRLERP